MNFKKIVKVGSVHPVNCGKPTAITMRKLAYLIIFAVPIGLFAFFVISVLLPYPGVTSPIPALSPEKTAMTANTIDVVIQKQTWTKRVDEIGIPAAYQEFIAENKNLAIPDQHLAMHVMGELIYEKAGLEGLALCDSSFSFGCYHSFFGRAIADRGMDILKGLNAICLRSFGTDGTGCQHGLGHGILEYLGHQNLVKALEACEDMGQIYQLLGCTSGVFMEYNFPVLIGSDRVVLNTRALDQKNPYHPCPSVHQKYRPSCFFEIPAWWDKTFMLDYPAMGKLCSRINGVKEQNVCFKGIGHTVAPSYQYDIKKTKEVCGKMPARSGILYCSAGAAWSFFAIPEKRMHAEKLCADFEQNERLECKKESNLLVPR